MKEFMIQICVLVWIVILLTVYYSAVIDRLDDVGKQLVIIEQKIDNKNQEISSNREIIRGIINRVDSGYYK